MASRIPNKRFSLSMDKQTLKYHIIIAFSLFFLTASASFIFLSWKYNLLRDRDTIYFILFLMVFFLFGFTILRQITDKIGAISKDFASSMNLETDGNVNELNQILDSFNHLLSDLKRTESSLNQTLDNIEILKRFSYLSTNIYNIDDYINMAVENMLLVSKAQKGSIMLLDETSREYFTVMAAKGMGSRIQKGLKVPFQNTICKHAIIEDSPLLVEDVESDPRIKRKNDEFYVSPSFLTMPLKTNKRIVGVVNLATKEHGEQFDVNDINILTSLLSCFSFGIENVQRYQAEERLKREFIAVNKIIRTINTSLKAPEMLHSLSQELSLIIPHQWIGIAIMDIEGSCLNFWEKAGKLDSALSKISNIPLEGSLFGLAIRQTKMLQLKDTANNQDLFEMDALRRDGFKSMVVSPLQVKGKVIGALGICDQDPDAFESSEMFIIEQIAEPFAMAVEQVRLFENAEVRNRELIAINDIGKALTSSTFHMEKVMTYTISLISSTIRVEAGSVLIREGDELLFRVAIGERASKLKPFKLKIGQGIAGYVAARGEPIIINDVKNDPHFFSQVDNRTGFTTRTMICVPMVARGEIIGVIQLINKLEGQFTKRDLELLQSVASSASIAFDNAQLYQDLRKEVSREKEIRYVFQKYVPEEVIDEVMSRKESELFRGEAKQITVLNMDLRGFSQMAQISEPEAVVDILNYFFTMMGDIVFRYQGTIDKYLGDGLLALFGAIVTSPYDAIRAVMAAIEMRDAMAKVSEFSENKCNVPLAMGIAINIGDAILGNIGFEKKIEYTAIGEVINTVFRIEALTHGHPNAILISRDLYERVKRYLEVNDWGIFKINDGKQEIQVFEVLGRNNTILRKIGVDTPTVGATPQTDE